MTSLPSGVGLGWRPALAADLLRDTSQISLIEVIAESCYTQNSNRKEAKALSAIWPVIPHGVKLSLGSADGVDLEHARRLGALARELQSPAITEHIAFTRSRKTEIGHLTQLPRTREALQVLQKNVEAVKRVLPDVPFLLENIAWSFTWPEDEMSEGDFYCEVANHTGCDLLLDVSNLYANALNSGQDPTALLLTYPLERVGMVHIAGGIQADDFYFDTHSRPTPEPVFSLLRQLFSRRAPVPVVLERDADYPGFDALFHELEAARDCLHTPLRAAHASKERQHPKPEGAPDSSLQKKQEALAACLTNTGDIAENLADGFGKKALERSRKILARKRVENAVSLLGNLGQHPKAAQLGARCTQLPRAPVGVAIADAFRIATEALSDPALYEDACLDLLFLRARFVGPLRDGSMRPRWAPFIGYEGRARAVKSFGLGAAVNIFLK